MKNLKLPKMSVNPLYRLSGLSYFPTETTNTTSQGDPENTCTTLITTTHFVPR